MKWIIAILILTLGIAIMSKNMSTSIYEKEHDEPLVMALAKDDKELAESVREAQKSLEVFLNLYEQYKDTVGVYFCVKVPIRDGEDAAHFWYTFNGLINDKIIGEHFELPDDLKEHKSISVEKSVVEDWMINDHGHLYGGYSIRLQRERTPENEREKFDEYVGVKVYKENDF